MATIRDESLSCHDFGELGKLVYVDKEATPRIYADSVLGAWRRDLGHNQNVDR